MKSRNLAVTAAALIPRNNDDVATAVKTIAGSGPQAVILAMQSTRPSRVHSGNAQSRRQHAVHRPEHRRRPQWPGRGEGVMVVQVTPAPFVSTAAPIVRNTRRP